MNFVFELNCPIGL